VRFLLWRPENHVVARFPKKFNASSKTLMLCATRPECCLSRAPVDILQYILNMCAWDHFGDSPPAHEGDAGIGEEYVEDGIGWASGNYRSMIHQHMQQSAGEELGGRGMLTGNLPRFFLPASRLFFYVLPPLSFFCYTGDDYDY
jgi:hypothetical protein